MLFHPAIIALLVGSGFIGFLLLYSAYYGVRILREWNIRSGSELQLRLERRTYLISTMMTYAFSFQILSFFLFIYTVDRLSALFVGAMCAAGTLNLNPWGYPTLLLKLLSVLLAGLWLILNVTDNRGYDYPLIKKKYGFLLLIVPLIFTETFLQARYFLSLKPDIITSCCGALFTSETQSIVSKIIAFPRGFIEAAFFLGMGLTFGFGILFYRKERGGYIFSLLSLIIFLISILALISFFSLYFYELPTHHCPFCILQREYGYVGYPLYIALLGGGVSGMGVGLMMPFRKIESLKEAVPSIQRKLLVYSLASFALFLIIVLYRMVFSNLKLYN